MNMNILIWNLRLKFKNIIKNHQKKLKKLKLNLRQGRNMKKILKKIRV